MRKKHFAVSVAATTYERLRERCRADGIAMREVVGSLTIALDNLSPDQQIALVEQVRQQSRIARGRPIAASVAARARWYVRAPDGCVGSPPAT